MLVSKTVSREGMGLNEISNVVIAALHRAYKLQTVTFYGTCGSVVFLKGSDNKNYSVEVRDHDAIVTQLNF